MSFVLASSSSERLNLLRQLHLTPLAVSAPNIVETPLPRELPRQLAERLAAAKVEAVSVLYPHDVILGADTVIGVGRRILDKTNDRETALAYWRLLSGRRHRAYTGICVRYPDGKTLHRVVETQVQMKRLSEEDLLHYLETEEWKGAAGGYRLQGLAGAFVKKINGSPSNVCGLPLLETYQLLKAACGKFI